jgi:hypothetical protein
MFIKYDFKSKQLLFNHEQIVQDKDFSELYQLYGWQGVKFTIDYFWHGSPYATLPEQDRIYEAYHNCMDWFSDSKALKVKNEQTQLDVLHHDCIINYDIIKRCGHKSNKLFRVSELETYNSFLRKEQEYQQALGTIDVMKSIRENDTEAASENIELSNKLSKSLRELSRLRKESESSIGERLSETKIAGLDSFM